MAQTLEKASGLWDLLMYLMSVSTTPTPEVTWSSAGTGGTTATVIVGS